MVEVERRWMLVLVQLLVVSSRLECVRSWGSRG